MPLIGIPTPLVAAEKTKSLIDADLPVELGGAPGGLTNAKALSLRDYLEGATAGRVGVHQLVDDLGLTRAQFPHVVGVAVFGLSLAVVPQVFCLNVDRVGREVTVAVVNPDPKFEALVDRQVDLVAPTEHVQAVSGGHVLHEDHCTATGGTPKLDEFHVLSVARRHVLNSHLFVLLVDRVR